jgi:hypothetical protein
VQPRARQREARTVDGEGDQQAGAQGVDREREPAAPAQAGAGRQQQREQRHVQHVARDDIEPIPAGQDHHQRAGQNERQHEDGQRGLREAVQ